MHFWIGDWYQKAFCSSGHLTPIIEAVHHRIMAAIYSPFARFKEVHGNRTPQRDRKAMQQYREYRELLFESSLLEAQKTLHIAWKALKLWQASPLEVLGRSQASAVHSSQNRFRARKPVSILGPRRLEPPIRPSETD